MSTVPVIFTLGASFNASYQSIWIAFVDGNGQLQTQQLSWDSFPYTFNIMKGTLVSLSAYTRHAAMFPSPIITGNTTGAVHEPFTRLEDDIKQFTTYALIAGTDASYTISNF